MHGGDRELIKILLEDNQWLCDSLVDLAKRFSVSSFNREDYESYTSHTLGDYPKADYDPHPPAYEGKEGYGYNGHDLENELVHADNQGVRAQGSGFLRVSALLRISLKGQKKAAPQHHQEVVDQPIPPWHKLYEDLMHFILNAVENYDKGEAKTARDLAKRSLGKERQSPFTAKIVNTNPPRKFSMPNCPIMMGSLIQPTMFDLMTKP